MSSLWRGSGVFPRLSGGFSKKVQSLRERQIVSKKLPTGDIEEVDPQKQAYRPTTLPKPKWPTRLFHFAHYPIILRSCFEAFSSEAFTKEVVLELFASVNLLYFAYGLYYYLVVFHRNPDILKSDPADPAKPTENPKGRLLLKRAVSCLPPAVSFLLLQAFASNMTLLPIVVMGTLPVLASAVVDVMMLAKDREVAHEDFPTKMYCSMTLVLYVLFIVSCVLYMNHEQKKEAELIEKYLKMSGERAARDAQAFQHESAPIT